MDLLRYHASRLFRNREEDAPIFIQAETAFPQLLLQDRDTIKVWDKFREITRIGWQNPTRVIGCIGSPGCGKSTTAKNLLKYVGYPHSSFIPSRTSDVSYTRGVNFSKNQILHDGSNLVFIDSEGMESSNVSIKLSLLMMFFCDVIILLNISRLDDKILLLLAEMKKIMISNQMNIPFPQIIICFIKSDNQPDLFYWNDNTVLSESQFVEELRKKYHQLSELNLRAYALTKPTDLKEFTWKDQFDPYYNSIVGLYKSIQYGPTKYQNVDDRVDRFITMVSLMNKGSLKAIPNIPLDLLRRKMQDESVTLPTSTSLLTIDAINKEYYSSRLSEKRIDVVAAEEIFNRIATELRNKLWDVCREMATIQGISEVDAKEVYSQTIDGMDGWPDSSELIIRGLTDAENIRLIERNALIQSAKINKIKVLLRGDLTCPECKKPHIPELSHLNCDGSHLWIGDDRKYAICDRCDKISSMDTTIHCKYCQVMLNGSVIR